MSYLFRTLSTYKDIPDLVLHCAIKLFIIYFITNIYNT